MCSFLYGKIFKGKAWIMNRFLMLITAIFLLFVSTSSFGSISVNDYNSVKRDLKYIEASSKVTRNSYIIVAEKFFNLYKNSPRSNLAESCLYLCANTYLKSYNRFNVKSDQKEALKYFRLTAVNYGGKWAAVSYIEAAKIYQDLDDLVSAKYMLDKLIRRFPNIDESKIAKDMMAQFEKQKKSNLSNVPVTVVTKPSVGKASRLTGIRYFSSEDYTRVVLDVDNIPKFEKRWLKANPEHNKPPRLFIDLFDTRIDNSIQKQIDIKDGLLSSVRWGEFEKGIIRVVLDSQNVKDFSVFAMQNPNRIVIDVSGDGANRKTTLGVEEGMDKVKETLAGVFGLKIRNIVIDPGHGGHDSGASYYGMNEKDIVLDIGLKLREKLSTRQELNIIMTRDKDIFIPLEERTAIANRKKADLFISIHVNASRNKSANGIETYVLNVTSDVSALEVAAFENQATEKSMSDLQGILKDIMLNSKLEESLIAAKFVQESLVSEMKEKDLGVKQAPFYVLVGAKMPSILVESGFLSNKDYKSKFGSPAYIEKIAQGIYTGVVSYIEKYNGKK